VKDLLLWIVAGLVLVALFADGGFELSPNLSPALNAKLDVNYSPDNSTTTIENQTLIDTNIERQQTTIIYQDAPAAAGGVNLVDAGPGRCATQVGDVVESEQGNGACFVWSGNRKYFINPNGNRWEVDSTGQQPPATSSTTVVTTTVLLAPDVPRTLPEFQAAFLRNGGELPFLWNLRSDDSKIKWLSQQGETWR
jgi:hypothetical protein